MEMIMVVDDGSVYEETTKTGFMDEFMAKTHRNPASHEENKQSEKGGCDGQPPRAAHGGGRPCCFFFSFPMLLIASSWTVVCLSWVILSLLS